MSKPRSPKLEQRRKWSQTVCATQCVRCLRPRPDVDAAKYIDWESTGNGGAMVCPGCLTPAERHAIDEADMALCEELNLREAVPVDLGAPTPSGDRSEPTHQQTKERADVDDTR